MLKNRRNIFQSLKKTKRKQGTEQNSVSRNWLTSLLTRLNYGDRNPYIKFSVQINCAEMAESG